MGSNMAENHPVGFQWVVEAKRRGARVIHVDPRFTRTSAIADTHATIRAGSDIAFLGGVVNYVLQNERDFREYVLPYTNAASIVSEDYQDTEDLDGLFSGWDAEGKTYDPASWQYEGMEVNAAAGNREMGTIHGESAHGAHGARMGDPEAEQRDETLQDPRCVYQVLRRHFARYTPAMVQQTCGVDQDKFIAICEALCENSGRERTSAFCYAVGWTQHSHGAQNIRTAAILQLLLGNIGRPGGGIMALRGHASIQGSTDIPTLYNLLPGYLSMPTVKENDTLDDYCERNTPPAGFWSSMRAYTVSLLKAWFGDAATPENDFCFGLIPRMTGDHSVYPTLQAMEDGDVEGFFVMGQNPTVGAVNGRLNRNALAGLKWLVVRDLVEVETASFWRDSPEIETGERRTEDIATEVFLLPAATHVEKAGTFTNTQRLLQWREQAVEPTGDCRSDLWFMHHLRKRVMQRIGDSQAPRDQALQALTWPYPEKGPHADPDPEAVLREINGYDGDGKLLSTYMALKDDGSTSAGCWIYTGCFADDVNQTARRKPGQEQTLVAPEWGWAWPLNRRVLYNRASADPAGKPWSERKRLVWWDEDAGKWDGDDIPDFKPDLRPDHVPGEGDSGPTALRGTDPFIMQADGKGWLFAPAGMLDGPLPTHYEPQESPVGNALYGRQQANPARKEFKRKSNPYNPTHGELGAEVFPYVMTTYRLTEHHTAGGMSRWLPYLAELQPEFFAEVSPELAAEKGLVHGEFMTIVTSRSAVEARVMVTERMTPLQIGEGDEQRTLHQVGLPYHWGSAGMATGDSANDLLSVTLDPNVQIGEYKAATCDVRPGRRPRGPARRELVDSYLQRVKDLQ
jgi:formate dehydrogenase major subunit